jgi:hypothetical protein
MEDKPETASDVFARLDPRYGWDEKQWSEWKAARKAAQLDAQARYLARQASKPMNFGSPSPRYPDEMIMIDGLSKKEIFERYVIGMRDMSVGPLTPAQKECAQMMWATRLKHKTTKAKEVEETKPPQVVMEWDSYDE